MTHGARYHKVYTRMWTSPGFRTWGDDMRLAAVYVTTCRHRNTEGLFILPLPLAAHELGWSVDRTQAALEGLEAAGFVALDPETDVIWLVDALSENIPQGDKSIKGATNALAETPETYLQAHYLAKCKEVAPELAASLMAHLRWTDAPSKPLRCPIEATSSNSSSSSRTSSTSSDAPGESDQADPSPSPVDAEAAADLPTILLRLAGYPTATPTAGERSTVEGCLARDLAPDDLRAIAARASLGDINPRALLLKLLTEALNDPASFRASTPAPPGHAASPGETRDTAWAAVAAIASRDGAGTLWLDRLDLSPRTRAAAHEARLAIRNQPAKDAKWVFFEAYAAAAEPVPA